MNTMEEYLNELSMYLAGEVSQQEINDTLRYYREYFAEERTHGKTDEEIMASLGSPRLIARSIIDAKTGAGDSTGKYTYSDASDTDEYNTYDTGSKRMGRMNGRTKLQDLFENGAKKVGCIAVAILAIVLIGFLARAFLPVVLVFALVAMIAGFFNRRY